MKANVLKLIYENPDFKEANTGIRGKSKPGNLYLRKLQSRPHWYAGAEELRGRMRSPISLDLFLKTSDRRDHDSGDEDRKER